MCYVAHLSGWDMILGTPALLVVRATISPVTAPLTLQPTSMDWFCLRMWQGNRLTDQKSDLSTAANSILALADELAVRAVVLENRFNPVEEFAALIPKEIPRELPPRRQINHMIDINTWLSWIPTYRPSGDRFKQEITVKITREEIYGRVWRAEEDTNAVVMFTQPQWDRPKELRLLLDYRPRNAVTIRNHTQRPNIAPAMEFVAVRLLWSKIDLTDEYHNMQIDSDSEQDTTILCHIGHYRNRVM